MKQKYQRVTWEIIALDGTDVIQTSGGDNLGAVKDSWFTTDMQNMSSVDEE